MHLVITIRRRHEFWRRLREKWYMLLHVTNAIVFDESAGDYPSARINQRILSISSLRETDEVEVAIFTSKSRTAANDAAMLSDLARAVAAVAQEHGYSHSLMRRRYDRDLNLVI